MQRKDFKAEFGPFESLYEHLTLVRPQDLNEVSCNSWAQDTQTCCVPCITDAGKPFELQKKGDQHDAKPNIPPIALRVVEKGRYRQSQSQCQKGRRRRAHDSIHGQNALCCFLKGAPDLTLRRLERLTRDCSTTTLFHGCCKGHYSVHIHLTR